MKKLYFLIVFVICGLTAFAQSQAIPFKVATYQISRRQLASQYTKAELIIDDEKQSWEIILYRKDNAKPEYIKLEKFDDIGRDVGVFRTVTIMEAAGTSGGNLFAHMPVFDGNKITVDLCDTRTEGVRRRLIIEYQG